MGSRPKASRPYMPGYGISRSEAGLLDWEWAEKRLTDAHNYWVSTVRPDGSLRLASARLASPHVVAVWGVWLEDAFYFSTGGKSRKTRNLRENPRCVITTERADEAVIVEGTAQQVTDPGHISRVLDAYKAKYGNVPPDPADNPIMEVRPHVVFGFIEHDDQFTTSATRWTFD